MRNKREDSTAYLTKIKRILGECYEQVYANKFNSLDEMGRSPTKTQTIENDSKRQKMQMD